MVVEEKILNNREELIKVSEEFNNSNSLIKKSNL
jgi:hypothetical protein